MRIRRCRMSSWLKIYIGIKGTDHPIYTVSGKEGIGDNEIQNALYRKFLFVSTRPIEDVKPLEPSLIPPSFIYIYI